MNIRHYLPSGQLSSIFLALLSAALLVWGAYIVTEPPHIAGSLSADTSTDAYPKDWEATLYAIQATEGSSSLPAAPDQTIVAGLRQGATSKNVTDTVGRTLLVNLTNAKAQGLGDDVPTQSELISSALRQVSASQDKVYNQSDMLVVADSPKNTHTYGNALAQAILKYPQNDYAATMVIIDSATSAQDQNKLAALTDIQARYKARTAALLLVPVPSTLLPFHLALVNHFEKMTESYEGLRNILSDPLKGLASVQTFKLESEQSWDVFTNIARAFNKGGILFTKDEPGAAWSVLLSSQ